MKICLPKILNYYLDDTVFLDNSKLLKKSKEVFDNWKFLFHKLINNEDDKRELLNFFEEFCLKNEKFKQIFQLIIQMLCYFEIVAQDIVLEWIRNKDENNEFKTQVKYFFI